MKIKVYLRNNSCITFKSSRYVTVDAFAEDLMKLKMGNVADVGITRVGDFIDLNSHYVRYDDIVSFTDEVLL